MPFDAIICRRHDTRCSIIHDITMQSRQGLTLFQDTQNLLWADNQMNYKLRAAKWQPPNNNFGSSSTSAKMRL